MRFTPLPAAIVALCLIALAQGLPNSGSRSASTNFELAKRDGAFGEGAAELRPRHEGHHDSSSSDGSSPMGMANVEPEAKTSLGAPTHPAPGDEHSHHNSHEAPLLVLNETQILLTHSPSPPAYFELDLAGEGQPGVLVTHIVFMSLSFFILLPISIFLKAGSSPLALVSQAAFVATSVLGAFFGKLYNSLTPNRYEGDSHSRLGWVVMFLVLALNAFDVAMFALKLKRWVQGRSDSTAADESEREGMLERHDEHEAMVLSPTQLESSTEGHPEVSWSQVHGDREWRESRVSSTHSDDDTIFDTPGTPPLVSHSTGSRIAKYGAIARMGLQGSLILLAYVELLSGVAVYSGSCREYYFNGCLAHTIKGSIFFWYGLLTFARFIGAFSSLGWAWNRRPMASKNSWSAEFVESLVIFTYGITNTWLERLGKTGAYSVKDMQHISIAVMFWFAGGLGMLLESRQVRSWLSQSALIASGRPASEVTQPSSASFSFNPFPGLVIGVTGVAMAAHHQTYQFQVDIHALWGILLGGFAAFRFLTYFFLYLRPPASILPSRPPTEALASFCLTCGGIVFILSTEEVTFAAMRNGWDDMMAFLNATVALVCIVFTWIVVLFAIKGWALYRFNGLSNLQRSSQSRSISLSIPERSPAAKGSYA